jgi:hypothetical protein
MNSISHIFGRRLAVSTLTLAGAIAVGLTASPVHAQSTSATVFGWAPAGETVTVAGGPGMHRHAKANDKGRYIVNALPMGTYTVALEKDGKVVDKRSNINLTVGRGAEIDFACEHDQCGVAPNGAAPD